MERESTVGADRYRETQKDAEGHIATDRHRHIQTDRQTDQQRDGETDKLTERAHCRLVVNPSNQPTDSETDLLSSLSDQLNSPRSASCPINRPTNQQLKRDIGSLDPSMANDNIR